MKKDLKEELEIPEKTQVTINKTVITIKGPEGEAQKNLNNKKIEIKIEGSKLTLSAQKATQREKRIMYAIKAHLKNMMRGVNDPHIYELKICSSHFPITAVVEKNKLTVKNFLGESKPREIEIKQGAQVKVEGDKITVTSTSKELAGQTAASIEQLCRVTNKDRRIFQDGIWLTMKDQKELK